MHMTLLLNFQNSWSCYQLWTSHLWRLWDFRGVVNAKRQRWWNKSVIRGLPGWMTTQLRGPWEDGSQLAFLSAPRHKPRRTASSTSPLALYSCSSPTGRGRELRVGRQLDSGEPGPTMTTVWRRRVGATTWSGAQNLDLGQRQTGRRRATYETRQFHRRFNPASEHLPRVWQLFKITRHLVF